MAIWALAIVAVAVLLGIAAFVGTFLGRRSAESRQEPPAVSSPKKTPAADELPDSNELADSVARDIEIVSSLLAEESPTIPPALMKAMQHLLRTTQVLSEKLQQVADSKAREAGSASPSGQPAAQAATEKSISRTKLPIAPPQSPPNQDDDDTDEDESGAESRRFPRSPCHGSLQATIYPPPSNPRGEPIRCSVLTRNLSCGGVGIAHSEKLFPKQVLVLEAVGRLLVAEVRWCRQLDDKFFIVGCRLIKTGE